MLIKEVTKLLRSKNKNLAVAESCTGGMVSKLLTDIPGSSKYFTVGIVAYSKRAKTKLLGVSGTTIDKYGAVSAKVAAAMASGARRLARSDLGIGISGIAGPGGGSKQKPVGMVFIALDAGKEGICLKYQFKGNRASIRRNAANATLKLLSRWLKQ